MTTFEHAMLAVTGVLAAGLPKKHGWQLAAMAGLVAVTPDWDGLTLLAGAELFDRAHRTWGHSAVVAAAAAAALGALDYRFDVASRARRVLERWCTARAAPVRLRSAAERSMGGYAMWMLVAIAAAWSHLLADVIFSGTKTLADWHVQLLWPFSDRGFVYPLVPWGDVGVTLIFAMSMFAMWRWRPHTQAVARITLAAVAAYVLARG